VVTRAIIACNYFSARRPAGTKIIACNNFSAWLHVQLEMWANAQRDGRPAEYRWRPLFNAAMYG